MKASQFHGNSDKLRLISYKISEKNLAELFVKLEKASYQPILIKGWAAAQNYPRPQTRKIGDIDLVFRPDAVDEKLFVYLYEITKEPFDVHKGFRHLDTLSFDDIFENTALDDCQGTPVRVLRCEDHLRILAVHWLTDGGAYKEKLWDIFYIIEKNRREFDWERCLGKVSTRRRNWILTVIATAHFYLGLDIAGLPFEKEIVKPPGWFADALEREWKSDVNLIPLFAVKNDGKKLIRQILKRIPPNPIQTAVNLEKDFGEEFRIIDQFEDFYRRSKPSWKRFLEK